ncbi:MAG: 50S ribosomal protein L6 [Acidilobaceae archaeon]|nr:50S ribosomal protein L6 [Acidilobaceae archaeon]MDW7974169.1 50S ribosomal protein L6 [Sulfolobales archaeon]
MARDVYTSREVEVPQGVTAEVVGALVKIKGPKGELARDFGHARGVIISQKDGKILIESFFPSAREKATVGSIAAHIKNMIVGVTRGFRYKLKVIYVHYPISVKVEKGGVSITNLIGEKHVRRVEVPSGVKVTVSGQDVIVEGIDIDKVAQTAARIEEVTRIKGKDRRKFSDGIYIYAREVM